MKRMLPNNIGELSTEELGLPKKTTTNAGFAFCPRGNIWEFVDSSREFCLDFNKLENICDATLILSLKKALLFYVQNRSASHSRNIFEQFYHFVQTIREQNEIPINVINGTDILNYMGSLSEHKKWYITVLSGFFKRWYALGHPGISPDVVTIFKQMRLKGNRKGDAVRTMDPSTGPFTDIELQALQSAVNDSFAAGEISTRAYVLTWLFMALGARNVQIAALKIKDFYIQRASDGTSSYLLNVPRAKQRASRVRDHFKQRALINEIGEALEAWVEQVKREFSENKSRDQKKQRIATGELPLFPLWGRSNPEGFEHHANGYDLAQEVLSVFKNLKVISERTGNIIHISTRRFRYTLGTRAALEGHGELIIADLLDHSDTQQVGVYVKATPEIINRIDKALALQLAPMAQAFMGQIVFNEADAERGDDSTSRIRSPKSDPNNGFVGNCGKYGFCGAFAPIACYTCRNFQAWLNGPHTDILDDLLSEREKLLKETGDERIAFANDRTIFAVAEVVRRCGKMKKDRGQSNGRCHPVCP